jgi:hypothetical protein
MFNHLINNSANIEFIFHFNIIIDNKIAVFFKVMNMLEAISAGISEIANFNFFLNIGDVVKRINGGIGINGFGSGIFKSENFISKIPFIDDIDSIEIIAI